MIEWENTVPERMSKTAATVGMVTGLIIIGGSILAGISLANGPDDSGQPTGPAVSTPATDDRQQPSSTDDQDGNGGSGNATSTPGGSTLDEAEDDEDESRDDDADKVDSQRDD